MYCKICGISHKAQLDEMAQSGADMLGINFYPPSPRYYNDTSINKNYNIKYTGVFVNASQEILRKYIDQYQLDYVQLHGDEDVKFCREVQKFTPIIKVFRLDEKFDFSLTDAFPFSELFLFDTKTDLFGGSGKKFNWEMLHSYRGDIPFLLSGGIGPDDAADLNTINHPRFMGVDINSRFEIRPGIKDAASVRYFIQGIKN